jgi:hypothetical protein
MQLRRWLVVPLAVPAALAVLCGLPLAARASVGVGVQAGPVRLAVAAHAGGSYSLPPVYVVNTGTEPELVSVRVERLSAGAGRAVPPSWVRAAGPGVRLGPQQGARLPLELVLPGGARPGRYLSDVVVSGSAAISAGRANLGVAAATKLEFRVAPGPAAGSWPAVPGSVVAVLAGLVLLALAIVGVRRSGLRIRVERRPAGPGAAGPGTAGSGAADREGGHHVA